MLSQTSTVPVLDKSSLDQTDVDIADEQEVSQSNEPNYLKHLSCILHNSKNVTSVRNAAARELQAYLTSQENFNTKLEQKRKWTSLNSEIKNIIKKNILNALETEQTRPSSAALCLAHIGAMELPLGQWPDLIHILINNITDGTDVVQESSLEAISHLCQIATDNKSCNMALKKYSKLISDAIISELTKETYASYLKVAAIDALTRCLKCVRENFEKESDKHFLMQLMCYSAQSTDNDIRVAALKCLAEIVLLYYPSLDLYMEPTVFMIGLQALKNDKSIIREQGINFWMNICKIEANLQKEKIPHDFWLSIGFHKPLNCKNRCYVKSALPHLMPILLNQLVEEKKLNENFTDVRTLTEDYFCLLSTCCGESICPYVLHFLEEQVKKDDWRYHCIAIKLFMGLDFNNVKLLVQSAMPYIIEMLKNSRDEVKFQALEMIRDTYNKGFGTSLSEPYLRPLIQILFQLLNAENQIAVLACQALASLAYAAYFTPTETNINSENKQNKQKKPMPSNKYCFQLIVHKILEAASRTDVFNASFSKSACDALRGIMEYTPEDCYDVFKELTREILDRLIAIVQAETSSNLLDVSQKVELETTIVTSLEGVLKRMRPEDAPEICDMIIFALLQMYNCITCKSANLRRAVLGVVSIILSVLKEKFLMFAWVVEPVLATGLRNCHEEEVYTISLRLIRGIFHVLRWKVLPYCHLVIPTLANQLKTNDVRESLKREILLVFEAVITGVGSTIKSYLNVFLPSVVEASQADVAQYAYLNVYSEVIKAIRDDADVYNLLQPYLGGIMRLISSVAEDSSRSDVSATACADLIKTLCATLGLQIKEYVDKKLIHDFLAQCRSSSVVRIQEAATFAEVELTKL